MPFFRFKGQWITPFVALFLAIAALGIVAGSLSYSASRKEAIKRLSKELTSELKVFSGLVTASTEKYEYLPRLVSEYETISEALENPRDMRKISQANRLLERLNAEAGAADIFVMDARGNTIAASSWNHKHSFIGNNYAFRPYFFDALNKGIGHFYAIGVTTGVPGYYLAHRLTKNNIPIGVVAVKVNISSLPVSWESGTVEILVTDERDIIFMSSRKEWWYRPMWSLTEAVRHQLESTRQYEGRLNTQSPFEIEDILGTD